MRGNRVAVPLRALEALRKKQGRRGVDRIPRGNCTRKAVGRADRETDVNPA